MITRVVFDKISRVETKSGNCPICKRSVSRTKTFYQTVNFLNRNKNGTKKTVDDIKVEIEAEARAWLDEPMYHKKCEKVANYIS